jgi:hypothetical protein
MRSTLCSLPPEFFRTVFPTLRCLFTKVSCQALFIAAAFSLILAAGHCKGIVEGNLIYAPADLLSLLS